MQAESNDGADFFLPSLNQEDSRFDPLTLFNEEDPKSDFLQGLDGSQPVLSAFAGDFRLEPPSSLCHSPLLDSETRKPDLRITIPLNPKLKEEPQKQFLEKEQSIPELIHGMKDLDTTSPLPSPDRSSLPLPRPREKDVFSAMGNFENFLWRQQIINYYEQQLNVLYLLSLSPNTLPVGHTQAMVRQLVEQLSKQIETQQTALLQKQKHLLSFLEQPPPTSQVPTLTPSTTSASTSLSSSSSSSSIPIVLLSPATTRVSSPTTGLSSSTTSLPNPLLSVPSLLDSTSFDASYLQSLLNVSAVSNPFLPFLSNPFGPSGFSVPSSSSSSSSSSPSPSSVEFLQQQLRRFVGEKTGDFAVKTDSIGDFGKQDREDEELSEDEDEDSGKEDRGRKRRRTSLDSPSKRDPKYLADFTTLEDGFLCNAPGCGKLLKSRFSLTRHAKGHMGVRPYQCSAPGCGKSFTESNTLKRHARIHTGEKPFRCRHPGCGRLFTDASNWRRHEGTHFGYRPFRCPIDGCPKSFSRGVSLRKHMEKVHLIPQSSRLVYEAVRRSSGPYPIESPKKSTPTSH